MEIQYYRKEEMLDVRDMKYNCLIFILIGFSISYCQPKLSNLIPTYNRGGYTHDKFKKDLGDGIVIFGEIRDFETNEAIIAAVVNIGCLTAQPDGAGVFKFTNLMAAEDIFLTCSAIGYRTIETNRFQVEKGDSLKICFFITQDDRPLINCEGQNPRR